MAEDGHMTDVDEMEPVARVAVLTGGAELQFRYRNGDVYIAAGDEATLSALRDAVRGDSRD